MEAGREKAGQVGRAKSRKGILLSGVYVETWRAVGSYSIFLRGGVFKYCQW